MKKNLDEVFAYFSFFSYAPTEKEIYTFFPIKISRKALHLLLLTELNKGKLIQLPGIIELSASEKPNLDCNFDIKSPHYTLPQYSMRILRKLRKRNRNIYLQASKTIQTYLSLLKWIPLVRFVGITGKSAVEGVRKNDDIDLFVITKRGLMWTTRFFVVLCAKILRIHGGKGVCLNLFFDESDLKIQPNKQNGYIAHEILQMKPLVNKEKIYEELLRVNTWIFRIFPNANELKAESSKPKAPPYTLSPIPYPLDTLFSLVQLPLIKKNKTGFLITPTQLWLFKQDFELKLKRRR